jgi:hypothetical protein
LAHANTGARPIGGLRDRGASKFRFALPVLDQECGVHVNRKALKRWAEERLSMHANQDGSLDALFRYDGTTCTNMGRPLTFHYNVKLGPRAEGYPVLEQRCARPRAIRGTRHVPVS